MSVHGLNQGPAGERKLLSLFVFSMPVNLFQKHYACHWVTISWTSSTYKIRMKSCFKLISLFLSINQYCLQNLHYALYLVLVPYTLYPGEVAYIGALVGLFKLIQQIVLCLCTYYRVLFTLLDLVCIYICLLNIIWI